MDSPPGLEDVRPWLAMHVVLEAGDVRVPRILARDVEAGFLLLEDPGPPPCLPVAAGVNVAALGEAALPQLLRLPAIASLPGFPDYARTLRMRATGLVSEWFVQRHLGGARES